MELTIFHNLFNRTILSVTTGESVICVTAPTNFAEGNCLPKVGRSRPPGHDSKVQSGISPDR